MDRYETIRELGKGSFGACLLVSHKTTGEKLVMKQIPLPRARGEQDECMQEATLMTRLNHRNIVGCEDCFVHKGTHLCIVMQWARWGLSRHTSKVRQRIMSEGRKPIRKPSFLESYSMDLDYLRHLDLFSPFSADPAPRGGDLEKVMKKHKTRGAAMPEAVITDVIAQLSLALEYLHSRKHPVLHRDIKAANVFLVPVVDPSSHASAAPAAASSAGANTRPLFSST